MDIADPARPLSPSQVNTYLDCSAKWHYKQVERLPDPPSGSLVRGRVVHKLIAHWFKHQIEGDTPKVAQLADAYEYFWDVEAEGAIFGAGESIDELKLSGATLAAKYIGEAAPEIEPAVLDVPVSGEIAGVPVRGFIDLLDVHGRVIDFKTAKAKPSCVRADYALQFATYVQLGKDASGHVRMDTLVATKTPQLIHIEYEVSDADRRLTERLYPHVRRCMQSGVYAPNRGSNLCSRKYCPFVDRCLEEFGGIIE